MLTQTIIQYESEKNFGCLLCIQNVMVHRGQIISKCLFGVFNFLQKTNEKSQPEVS